MGKVTFFLMAMVLLGAASLAMGAEGPKLGNMNTPAGQRVNRHNMSGLDTRIAPDVTYKAAYDSTDLRTTEICIFCHTPHNALPSTPLWGRRGTVVSSFGYYTSATLVIHTDTATKNASGYGEPNYSSRLCLSCHDGATALGAVLNGPEIPFVGGNNTIQRVSGDYNVFNPGTVTGVSGATDDATQHHHPVSFMYNDSVKSALFTYEGKTYKYPTENKPGGPPNYNFPEVKLDRKGYMQCITCHNPHQNMSDSDATTPFWVLTQTRANNEGNGNVYDSVCLSCHPGDLGSTPLSNPYPY